MRERVHKCSSPALQSINIPYTLILTSQRVLHLRKQVKAVEPDAVVVERCGKVDRIPFGTCIWTTGIRMHPLGETLAAQLQGQEHWRSLKVDSHLRVKGAPNIFALGDAATIEQARTPLLVPPSIRPTLHAGSHLLKLPHCMGNLFSVLGFQWRMLCSSRCL